MNDYSQKARYVFLPSIVFSFFCIGSSGRAVGTVGMRAIAFPPLDFLHATSLFSRRGGGVTNYAHQITNHPPDFQTFIRPSSWHSDLDNFDRLIAARWDRVTAGAWTYCVGNDSDGVFLIYITFIIQNWIQIKEVLPNEIVSTKRESTKKTYHDYFNTRSYEIGCSIRRYKS